MVRDPRSRAGERSSYFALPTLASRSKPSPHSPDGRLHSLCTHSSLPATHVPWKHFTPKIPHHYCGRKHRRCSMPRCLWPRVHSTLQRWVTLAGSRSREADRQRTRTTCLRGWRQHQMAPQDEGVATWSCLQLSMPRHNALLLRRARCQLQPCSRWDSIPDRSQCFAQ